MAAAAAAAAAALLLAPAPAHAGIRLQIEGVDGELLANVRVFLSLQRYATLDLSEETVNRLQQRAPAEVADALRPLGFYAPEVTGELRRDGANWVSRLVIRPGEPVLLGDVDVRVEGPGADEPFLKYAAALATLASGQRLHHGIYEHVKAELQRLAASEGYLDARHEVAELVVDPHRRVATVRLLLATGERYRFGATMIEQQALDPRFARRFLRYAEGDWYSSAALLRTQFALDDTAYFGIVEVLPGDRDPATRTVPVRIQATSNERHRYTVGIGYETDFGPRLRVGWENRRVNPRGHRLHFETSVARVNQSGTLRYVVPVRDPALERVDVELTAQNQELADTLTRGLTLRPSLTTVAGRWQRSVSVDFAHSRETRGAERRDNTLVVPGISFAPLPRGLTPAATAGLHGYYAELIGSQRALGSGANFLRFRIRNDWRRGLAPSWWLIGRGELGLAAVRDFEELPAQFRFFAGGDRSVRGFGVNALSPVEVSPGADRVLGTPDDQRLRTGGRYLLVASVEVERELPQNFGVAAFVDAGNALNTFARLQDSVEYSVGVGVRYRLPFVSIGLDVAQPVSTGRRPRLHLNIAPVF